MNKVQKIRLALGFVAMGVGSVMAEGTGAFDPAAVAGTATTTIGTLATAIGGLLAAAVLIYAGFLGYRKIREALNKA